MTPKTQKAADALAAELKALAATHRHDEAALRAAALAHLKTAFETGRADARDGLESGRLKGARCAEALSALTDTLLYALADFTWHAVLRLGNPTDAEKIALLAVGGYGRGRLAPGSDVDLVFLLPYRRNATAERFVEYTLYMLWDMGLKIGHATRSIDQCVKAARADHTICTALLDARRVWGAPEPAADLHAAFKARVVKGSARKFVAAKLAERDRRHDRAGRSRYLVEPDVKEGKGGLRDLDTLFWIARYCYDADRLDALVELGVLAADEARQFRRCEDFLWAVRCHLHFLTGRASERVSFDVQRALAERLGFTGGAGGQSVEQFMRRYFLTAKRVGDLTAVFCAALEERQKKPRARLPQLFRRHKQVQGFTVENGRLHATRPDLFARAPVNLIAVFHLADRHRLDIHPDTLRAVARNANRIDGKLRADTEANRLFLDILTSRKTPERSLRRMNEAGVLGRFIPDFGRIVALMQFNMYHHYTADEHLLRAIGILAEIDAGKHGETHPLAHALLKSGDINRRVIYLATLLHDIAKGRPEDHSAAGARIAARLAPRLGFDKAETQLVQWLVRHHLLLSDVAQRRDLSDTKTIEDFVAQVQTRERLKHLLVLTVVDIKAVGPGVFTEWEAQLVHDLYELSLIHI